MTAIQIRSLTGVSLATITATFNEAFSDYFINLQFTEAGMAEKLQAEGVKLVYSVGAFDGEKLVGFMLHGVDTVGGVQTVYNGGTGVLPAYRNKGITTAMYEYCIPQLKQLGIYKHVLEVIDSNAPAITVYEKTGFVKQRHLSAFKCATPITAPTALYELKDLDAVPSDPAFVSVQPAWQNTTASIERSRTRHRILGAYLNDELIGYAVYIPATGRINQCAVRAGHRRKGVGATLLAFMSQNCNGQALTITNVETAYTPAISFLEAIGFEKLLGLYEMEMRIS